MPPAQRYVSFPTPYTQHPSSARAASPFELSIESSPNHRQRLYPPDASAFDRLSLCTPEGRTAESF